MHSYKCSVLVVDDEPSILVMLRSLLADDFEVYAASSAEEAREILSRRDIDIVLTDQRLPGMSGVQLLEWVRARTPRTMRILMTGMARLEDAIEAINGGRVHHYLLKPWRADQLIQTLRNTARAFLLERSHEGLLEELRRLNLELDGRIRQRTRQLEEANRQLADANRQLQQKNSILQKMALTDPLTGLPNRRAMDRLARTEWRRRARVPGPVALGLIDADFFRDINKAYLHTGGDHALTWLGRTLAGSVRTGDTIGRVGGEEFMLLAPDLGLAGAAALAERVRAEVAAGQTEYGGQVIRLTVSVGVVTTDDARLTSYGHLRHAAAAALNEAKRTGRNRAVVRALAPTVEQAG